MYQPTTRVLTVLELLQTYGQISSRELASRLEVNQRSVRRYITMLQDLGVPVESERGRHGGYRLRPGYKLPPLMFTNSEALAVTLGLLNVERLGLGAHEPAIEGALAKVTRVLPESVRDQVNTVQNVTVMDNASGNSPASADTVIALSQAVQQSRQVWIHYASPLEETTRVINPYGLVLRDSHWYAVGWCHLREDLRIFRLDRIRRHRVLSATFARPADFDARETVIRSLERRFDQPEVEIVLHTSLNSAREWVSVITGTLRESDAGVVFTCNTRSVAWLAWFVASMPWPVTVRRPAALMDELANLSQHIAAIGYDPDQPEQEELPERGRRSLRPA